MHPKYYFGGFRERIAHAAGQQRMDDLLVSANEKTHEYPFTISEHSSILSGMYVFSHRLSRLAQCCPVSLNLCKHCLGWRFDRLITCICSTLKHFGKGVPPSGIDAV